MKTNDQLAVKAFVWGCVSMSVPYIGWIFGIIGLKLAKEALSNEFQTEKAGKIFATCAKTFSTVGIWAGLGLVFFMILYFIIIFSLVAHY